MSNTSNTTINLPSSISPMSSSGVRLKQSTTISSKPKLAQVYYRVAAKVKRKRANKNKNKNKNKDKNIYQSKEIFIKTDEKHDEKLLHIFLSTKGFCIDKKLADTLQGKIYRCKSIRNEKFYGNETVVIKVTRKDLHFAQMTILENGTKKQVQENIIKERDIIKELTNNNNCNHNHNHNDTKTKSEAEADIFMTRYIDFFENDKYYFLVMEDGGSDLFEYVVKCHNLIRKGKLDRKEWRLMCKKIFRQIVQLLDYLHNKHNICHLDISLENMLIKNGTILQNINTGKISLNRNITLKFCDFGLSEKFDPNNHFKCTKYVGKTRYKSPELWTKKMIFDARSNDIWSLGITLFMMIVGVPPLKYPDANDDNFGLIISGQILDLIQSWNRAKFMTPQVLDLLTRMLTKEHQRIDLNEIKKHSWVKLLK